MSSIPLLLIPQQNEIALKNPAKEQYNAYGISLLIQFDFFLYLKAVYLRKGYSNFTAIQIMLINSINVNTVLILAVSTLT